MKKTYYIGMDGGGTKTDAAICDEIGRVLYRTREEGCNPSNIGVEGAISVFQRTLHNLLEKVGAREDDTVYAFIGAAGCGVGNNKYVISERLTRAGMRVTVDSDIVNVIQTGLRGDDGVAVIAGTGSLIASYKDGTVKKLGGNGYLFEEGGSGFSLGRSAIIAALNDIDGVGKKTSLTQLVREKLGKDPKEARGELCRSTPNKIAEFAPLVAKAYAEGDGIAKQIVGKNLGYILRYVRRAAKEFQTEKPKVAFVGGIFNDLNFCQYVSQQSKGRYELHFVKIPPVYGAIRKAVISAGRELSEEFCKELEKTL